MKAGADMVEELRYKLQMFGVPIDGYTNVFYDNDAIYKNTITSESVLNKKHHIIDYHRCSEAVTDNTIRVAKQRTENNLSDPFTGIMTASRRRFLLEMFTY